MLAPFTSSQELLPLSSRQGRGLSSSSAGGVSATGTTTGITVTRVDPTNATRPSPAEQLSPAQAGAGQAPELARSPARGSTGGDILPFPSTVSGFGPEAARNLIASGQASALAAEADPGADEPPGEEEDVPAPDFAAGTVGEEDVGPDGFTEFERAQLAELQSRDAAVRDHEEAHARVGGEYAGEPRYEFQIGPDGQNYAVSGAVRIDVSPVKGDPEATIMKMEIVRAAALAPAEPSAADRRIAALADALRLAAVAELNQLRLEDIARLTEPEQNEVFAQVFRQTNERNEPSVDIAA